MGAPIIYSFTASWCGPCRLQRPELKRLKDRMRENVDMREIDVDESSELAAQYGIRVVPTLVIERDGKSRQVFEGITRAEVLEGELKKLLYPT
ncbi:MAG: thioredoxin family protein [Methermicoccaceae archaeon]